MATIDETNLAIHKSIIEDDYQEFTRLLNNNDYDLSSKDKHGNTPLHLAVMLGRLPYICTLREYNAPVKVRNLCGWTPLSEAISYGDRNIINALLLSLKQQVKAQNSKKRPQLIRALKKMDDFYMELKWDFQSWVPFLSRILPSDVCKIHKSDCKIRMDTTLVDFSDMKWERGDISFIFRGDKEPDEALTLLDNKFQRYQRAQSDDNDLELDDEVDILMSNDIIHLGWSTKNITFSRVQSGWIFREDRKETIAGLYNCDVYNVNGLILQSRKRREHLTPDDLQKNKAILESLTKGNRDSLQNGECSRRSSLTPPPQSIVTWDEYINAEAGKHPTLGRQQNCKESLKTFRANLAMSDNFPLTVDMLLDILEVVAPFKQFAKLREFVEVKLPNGFPVKIEIPILPTISAKITFQKFEFRKDIPPELFEIPKDYVYCARLPDL